MIVLIYDLHCGVEIVLKGVLSVYMGVPLINHCRTKKIDRYQTSQQQPGQRRNIPQFGNEFHEQTVDIIGEIEFLGEIVGFSEVSVRKVGEK